MTTTKHVTIKRDGHQRVLVTSYKHEHDIGQVSYAGNADKEKDRKLAIDLYWTFRMHGYKDSDDKTLKQRMEEL